MVMKLTGFKVKNPWLQPMGKSPASVLPDNSPLIPPVVRRGRDLVLTKEGKTDCGGSVFPKHNQILICPLLDAFGVGSDATTAKLSVANEDADKRLSRTTYRFVGHKVRALPEYPN